MFTTLLQIRIIKTNITGSANMTTFRKHDHISPVLSELHWLPISSRINFKLCVLVYNHFEGTLPPYLSSILQIYHPPHSLRSSSDKLLVIPRVNLKSAGAFLSLDCFCWVECSSQISPLYTYFGSIQKRTWKKPTFSNKLFPMVLSWSVLCSCLFISLRPEISVDDFALFCCCCCCCVLLRCFCSWLVLFLVSLLMRHWAIDLGTDNDTFRRK